MNDRAPSLMRRVLAVSMLTALILAVSIVLGISLGSTGAGADFWSWALGKSKDPVLEAIVWNIRLPRVMMAALVGAVLSLGGLVFQALLRNPLAEPYILGISGGSAVGAIIGILMGLSRFPGVSITAFAGSMATLALILMLASERSILKKDSLLLSGVMVNAFCTAVIMFLVSMTQDSRLHNIIYWLMGDLASADISQVRIIGLIVLPCVALIFGLSHAMNLLLMGKEMARTMGVNIAVVTLTLLTVTSLMVSVTVSACGLLGFVGLVIPHLLRLILGPDHRVLAPACIFGGGAYMVLCDVLARVLPQQGEMPAGVITAMIGAPLFVFLLKRSGS
ncbi:MAG: iron ABC transporter permease [Desulfobacterales bacterium]|nr:iron ABC transporter permease [Desulfobacterales bacterium]MDD3081585.1 iron ABC transporter permease [Desulfobacterales bacterium]MDD3950899.1 iron ABC transporter permease [Desulfobacterales bacterium]